MMTQQDAELLIKILKKEGKELKATLPWATADHLMQVVIHTIKSQVEVKDA